MAPVQTSYMFLEDWEDDAFEIGGDYELVLKERISKPFYLISELIEPLALQKYVLVAVQLPSGVARDRIGKQMCRLELV